MRIFETVNGVLLLFFLLTAPSTADIKSIKIQSDNRRMILLQKFGLTHRAYITVAASSVSVNSTLSPPDLSRQGVFLLSEESMPEVLLEFQQNPDFCILRSKFALLLFTFRDLSPKWSFNRSFPVMYPSEYSLFFANCDPGSRVTMDFRTELLNTDG
ncbi:putative transmembrane protein GPR107/GPR108 [Helianthus debilis subsp. tardiflorus]